MGATQGSRKMLGDGQVIPGSILLESERPIGGVLRSGNPVIQQPASVNSCKWEMLKAEVGYHLMPRHFQMYGSSCGKSGHANVNVDINSVWCFRKNINQEWRTATVYVSRVCCSYGEFKDFE